MGTVIAITLAVIDSICFAAAAVVQQRAVRHTVRNQTPAGARTGSLADRSSSHASSSGADLHPRHHRLNLRGLLSLPKQPGWLAGIVLMGLGGTLHIIALALAPISVIQPIGVLGVPIAILLAARLDRIRPARQAVIPIIACVLSIAGFVWLAASHIGGDHPVALSGLLLAEAVLLIVAAVVVLVTRRVHGWARCVLNAVAGAMAVGMVAALMRAIAQHLKTGNPIFDPATVAMVGLVLLNMAIGGWLVQQAYASGRAEVVLACLTVVDPMVAVLIGLVLLGEGALLAPLTLAGMTICGLAAIGGVIALARSHPGVGPSPASAVAPQRRDQTSEIDQLSEVGGRSW